MSEFFCLTCVSWMRLARAMELVFYASKAAKNTDLKVLFSNPNPGQGQEVLLRNKMTNNFTYV